MVKRPSLFPFEVDCWPMKQKKKDGKKKRRGPLFRFSMFPCKTFSSKNNNRKKKTRMASLLFEK